MYLFFKEVFTMKREVIVQRIQELSSCFENETQEEYSNRTNAIELRKLIADVGRIYGYDSFLYKMLNIVWISCVMSENSHISLTLELIADRVKIMDLEMK